MADWKLDFVWAFKIRRADAPQWAAIIHRKNIDFGGFDLINMDSQGGGQWIQPELGKPRHMIRGTPTEVQPIASIEDEIIVPLNALFSLSLFKISDSRIQKAFGHMKMSHPTNLVDCAHVEFMTAWGAGVFGLPAKYKNRDMTTQWSDERIHANQMLDLMAQQLVKICVQTDNSGKFFFNNFMARIFGSKGRKDFACAALYAFTAFFCWLKTFEHDDVQRPGDKAKMGHGGHQMTGHSQYGQNTAAMGHGGGGVIRRGVGDMNPYA